RARRVGDGLRLVARARARGPPKRLGDVGGVVRDHPPYAGVPRPAVLHVGGIPPRAGRPVGVEHRVARTVDGWRAVSEPSVDAGQARDAGAVMANLYVVGGRRRTSSEGIFKPPPRPR